MSKIGVKLSINVSMIEKARLFEGKKGKYLDCTIFLDPDNRDQYGNNGMITQDVSKEERESGVKGPILGNGKVTWKEGGQSHPQPQNRENQSPSAPSSFDDFDDTPF